MQKFRGTTTRVAMAVGVALATLLIASGTSNASARPQQSPQTVYGLDTFFDYHCQPTREIKTWATTQFKAFKALGANAVGIAFPLYTLGLRSNSIFAKTACGRKSQFQSPSPNVLGDVINIAHAQGLTVLLRPLLDEKVIEASNPRDYRGSIRPTNVATWFQNYVKALFPYLLTAQKDHAESFSISSELNSLARSPEWPSTIVNIHKVYTGTQVFTFSFNQQIGKVVKPGTSEGVDFYPLTNLPPSATPAKILATWNNLLKSAQYKMPGSMSTTTIDELGIPSQNGAYKQPSAHFLNLRQYPFNQMIQVNWYTAACNFVKSHGMAGVYFWGSYLTQSSGRLLSHQSTSSPQNMQPLTQKVVKACFG